MPDATIALNYMLHLTIRNPLINCWYTLKPCLKNLNLTGDLAFSQTILTHLVDKGAVRDEAYRWVQNMLWNAGLKAKILQQV